MEDLEELAGDLLLGAGAIALDVFGDDSQPNRRKIYHLHEMRGLPTFKLAGELAARRSRIRQHIAALEEAAGRAEPLPPEPDSAA